MRCAIVVALMLSLGHSTWAAQAVNQPARKLPVAYQVDVAVIGGSTGGVAAAVAAAEAGAKVFLAAERPYLGDDITATLQLWLEAGETPDTPLAAAIYKDPLAGYGPDPRRIALTYTADRKTAKQHADTNPPSVLTDGQSDSSSKHSVQYDGDVQIVADLGKSQAVREVRLLAFQREAGGQGGSAFKVSQVVVEASADKSAWQSVGTIDNTKAKPEDHLGDDSVTLSLPCQLDTRYLKLTVKKDAEAARILLGELEVIGPEQSGPRPVGSSWPRPMHVKRVLDEALLKANVPFLFSCYATEIVRDGAGKPCGVVVANRAGRQVVLAKTIVDATGCGTVARLAGAKFRAYPAGNQTFKRVVIGGDVQKADGMTARVIDPPFRGPYPNRAGTASGTFQIIEYTLQLPMADGSYASLCRADQKARTLTYHDDQQFTSDVLWHVAPNAMHAQAAAKGSEPIGDVPVAAFRPAGVERVFVLGAAADVSREQAAALVRPVNLIKVGGKLGAAAAVEAKAAADIARPAVAAPAQVAQPVVGQPGELLGGVRPVLKYETIDEAAGALPVIASYDVLVIGGGTAGAPAGIAAARQGAKTLVVEYLSGLGGVGTLGAISTYCVGNRVGFTATVMADSKMKNSWPIEQKCEWWRKALLDAGADIWFGAAGCGAVVDSGKVVGAIVATPQGRGIVLAKAVIDATGNADVAAAAGAECRYTDQSEIAMQGTGLPQRRLGDTYYNTDFTLTDETDLLDVWHLYVFAKQKYQKGFDLGQLIDTRERRMIVGDFTQSVLDQINRRTYPDTVVQALGGKLDTHGYTVDPSLTLVHPNTNRLIVNIPYRCMLPKGLEGLLVVGLGMSMHRDATPLTRMQPDIQNGGYAAGVAAAMSAKSGTLLRHIDIKALQRHLVEIGNLTEAVLSEDDSYPLSAERIAEAVANIPTDPFATAAVFVQPQQAIPLLRQAYAKAEGEAKLAYAGTLALLGDRTGVDTLIASLERTPWDAGWNYKGMGQFGNAFSPVDGHIVALGYAGDRRAVPAIVAKLNELKASDAFSHFRAVALALEMLGDRQAAKPLADALRKPGIAGYVHGTLAEATERNLKATATEQTRRESIRELSLARALFRLGDYESLGRQTLAAYARDLRGHMARHAQAVLDEKK